MGETSQHGGNVRLTSPWNQTERLTQLKPDQVPMQTSWASQTESKMPTCLLLQGSADAGAHFLVAQDTDFQAHVGLTTCISKISGLGSVFLEAASFLWFQRKTIKKEHLFWGLSYTSILSLISVICSGSVWWPSQMSHGCPTYI